MMYKVSSITLLPLIVLTYFLLCNTVKANAFSSQDNEYIFHIDVNTDNDNQQNLPYNQPGQRIRKKISQTPTPTPAPEPMKTSIQIGYTDKQSSSDFRFTLSDALVNFGPLSPTNFITRKNVISILGDQSYRYSVIAFEDHQLNNGKNQFIPNTGCDTACTEKKANTWTNTLTFGFGYRCENSHGSDCLADFADKDTYKEFADASISQAPQTVLEGILTEPKQANILYKVNVPGTQAPGVYQNTITYLALPMY